MLDVNTRGLNAWPGEVSRTSAIHCYVTIRYDTMWLYCMMKYLDMLCKNQGCCLISGIVMRFIGSTTSILVNRIESIAHRKDELDQARDASKIAAGLAPQ